MRPTDIAKSHGCRSMAEVERVSGFPYKTLLRYAKHRPERFKTLCIGVAYQTTRAGHKVEE